MTFTDIARRIGRLAADNSPTILTSVGVVGVVTTAFLTAKATVKATEELDMNAWRETSPKEKLWVIKETGLWKLYIPAVTTGAATIICVIGANRVGSRRAAAIAGASAVLERSFDEYKRKVVATIGEKKDDAIHAAIAQDRVNENPPPEHFLEGVKLLAAPDRQLCLDLYGGLYFTGSVEKIGQAVNSFNHMLNMDGLGSLADLYRMLDIDTVPTWAESVGWNQDRLVEHQVDTTLVHETYPALVLRFRNEPHHDYGRSLLSRY